MKRKNNKLSERDKNLIFLGLAIGSVVTLLTTLIAITLIQNIHLFNLKDINTLNSYTDIIQRVYYKDIDKNKLKSDMYNGLFSSLDEYSCYYSKEDYTKMNADISKEFYGIGITYGLDSYVGEYRIINVFENSPADISGLKINDIIREVDGVEITGLNIDEVKNLLLGDNNTVVNLKILRGTDILDFFIKRSDLKVTYSSGYRLTNDIGYIRIESFIGDVATDFENSLKIVKNCKSIIIDLRNNPGGDIDIMMNILKQITPNGLVTTLYYKNGDTFEYRLTDGVDLKYNFIILVNNKSASCSEIMTAYMQENNYATVVGSQTFGKGIVQGVCEMEDGSAIKLTVASYLTPNGKDLGSVGLTPDVKTSNEFSQISCIEDVLNDKDVKVALDMLH